MVRLNVAQVVWKNSEDEILKAAVMKYGLNQWGRVASLFAKRSAKACKARWDEWLDPRIKKTEWSREEDEKLLYLAKLMPTQWRTIAPMVGRTASQCLERYERLLDAVGGGEEEEEEGKRRQLQAPETLPAKPDAVDLEDEETEMLSEARARLANTLGKKAKRKARERQLEAQQRQTMMQKRREMKAAGLAGGAAGGVSHSRRKRKNSDPEQIDFVNEVPFELLPPQHGLYDVKQENMESLRRERDERARIANLEKMSELKKQRTAKSGGATQKKTSAKELELKLELEKQRNEEALRIARGARAAAFALPQPQVSDSELEDVAKISSSSTGVLAGAFAAPALPKNRKLELEAKAQLAREQGYQSSSARAVDDDAASVAGRVSLPSLASRRTFAGTNGRVVVLRDELGINRTAPLALQSATGGGAPADEVLEDAEHLADSATRALQDSLRNLPQPEYEYSVQVKRAKLEEDDEKKDAAMLQPDARQAQIKRQRMVEDQNQAAAAARPSAVKLNLPDVPPLKSTLDAAEDVIWEEMQRALRQGDSISVDISQLPEMLEITNFAAEQFAKLTPQDLATAFASTQQQQLVAQAKQRIAQISKQNSELEVSMRPQYDAQQTECAQLQAGLFRALQQVRRETNALEKYQYMKQTENQVIRDRLLEASTLLTTVQREETELQNLWANNN